MANQSLGADMDTVNSAHAKWLSGYGPMWRDSTGWFVHFDGLGDIEIVKTTNDGDTWADAGTTGLPITVTGHQSISTWDSAATPGIGRNTDSILIAWTESNTHDVDFRIFNPESDTLEAQREVKSLTSIASAGLQRNQISTTRAESGRIYVACDPDDNVEDFFRYSDDEGASWSADQASPYEADNDEIILMPSQGHTDTDDIYGIYYDDSAGEWTLKNYDASGNTWSELTNGLSGVTGDSPTARMVGYTFRPSDGAIMFMCHTDSYRTASSDIAVRFFDGADATTALTSKTNVETNNETGFGVMCYEDLNDRWYAFFADGDIIDTATTIFYRTSDDDGGTWSGQNTYTTSTDTWRIGIGQIVLETDGGNIQPAYNDGDGDDLWYVDDANHINIPKAAGGGGPLLFVPQMGRLGSGTRS